MVVGKREHEAFEVDHNIGRSFKIIGKGYSAYV